MGQVQAIRTKTALIWRKSILIYVQQMYNSVLWVSNKYS